MDLARRVLATMTELRSKRKCPRRANAAFRGAAVGPSVSRSGPETGQI